MQRKKSSELTSYPDLNEIKEIILKYLEKMDAIHPSQENIFKRESSKVDLETKVWHHFHKLEAAEYYYKQVVFLTLKTREFLNQPLPEAGNSGEYRFSLRDDKILFELEAFFTAVQSSVDFLACVLSRYIKGKNTDEFDKLHKFTEKGNDPISILINDNWFDWVEDMAKYRDYLVHRGVLQTPQASMVSVNNATTNPLLIAFLKDFKANEKKSVVFPVPIKPNPDIRLTRRDILGNDEPELPPGIAETAIKVNTGSGKGITGPSVSVSVGRNVGSFAVNAKSKINLGKSNEIVIIQYELANGFAEAETLCAGIFDKQSRFSFNIFLALSKLEFVHII